MKSQEFHTVANRKVPGETMCIHWFLFPPMYREVFNPDNSILPTQDVSGLSDYLSSLNDKNKGDKGWLLLLQKRMTFSGGGFLCTKSRKVKRKQISHYHCLQMILVDQN